MNKYKILNCGKKRTFAWWPEGKKARKACQKAMMAFGRVVFRFTSPTKRQTMTFAKTKAEARIKKEQAKKEHCFNPDCQPQKHPMKKDMAALGNQTISLPVIGLTIPGLQMLGGYAAHGRLDRDRQSKKKKKKTCMVLWHYDRNLLL